MRRRLRMLDHRDVEPGNVHLSARLRGVPADTRLPFATAGSWRMLNGIVGESPAVRAALALCALCGCECMLDRSPPGVRQVGSEVPPRADEVVAASASICGRDLRGEVTWTTELFTCDGSPRAGCSRVGGCHLEATVLWMPDALQTALAHEIGHFCWETDDEARANEFAAEVRRILLSPRHDGS